MSNHFRTWQHRDLSLTALPTGILVTACDSCGGAGSKPADVLQIPPYYSGRFTTRVALMEVLSSGAVPVVVVNAVACEMDPTGQEIIRGVREELAAANVDADALTGSTEENFPTAMTALGITVVGYLPGFPNWQDSYDGDLVFCVGKPKVGAEVQLDGDPEMASYQDLHHLHQISGIREIIPTGSKGIRYEAQNAAAASGLRFLPLENQPLDLERSTGPASCLLVLAAPESASQLNQLSNCVLIGTLQL